MARLRGAREAGGSSIRDELRISLPPKVLRLNVLLDHRATAPESRCGKPFKIVSRSREGVQQALAFIDARLGERLTLMEIADELKLSPYHFAHVFKRVIGIAPHQYVMQRRLERAKQLLTYTSLPIVEIAVGLGYASQSHFTEVFRRQTGVTPLSYRLRR